MIKRIIRHKIVNYISGFTSATFLIGLIFLLILGILFWSETYEPIQFIKEYLMNYLLIFGMIILLTIPIIILKKKRPNFVRGFIFGFIWILIALIYNSIDTYKFLFPPAFDPIEWKQSNPKPFRMACRLIKDDLALNKTSDEIIDLFGDSYIHSFDRKYVYSITKYNFVYLEIEFDEDGISKRVLFRYYD